MVVLWRKKKLFSHILIQKKNPLLNIADSEVANSLRNTQHSIVTLLWHSKVSTSQHTYEPCWLPCSCYLEQVFAVNKEMCNRLSKRLWHVSAFITISTQSSNENTHSQAPYYTAGIDVPEAAAHVPVLALLSGTAQIEFHFYIEKVPFSWMMSMLQDLHPYNGSNKKRGSLVTHKYWREYHSLSHTIIFLSIWLNNSTSLYLSNLNPS